MNDTDQFEAQDLPPSKSQLKRDALALQALGAKLLELPESDWAALGLPDDYPFRLHDAAREKLRTATGVTTRPLRHEVSGLSRGTALAIVLADYGLGFRPLRTPGGAINLVAEPLDDLLDLMDDPLRVGGGKVDLVYDRNQRNLVSLREVNIRDGLGLDAGPAHNGSHDLATA